MAEEFFANVQYSRRLLLRSSSGQEPPPPPFPLPPPPPPLPLPLPSESMNNTFDANAVMVLVVLLCALICSLGVNSIIRCACRCSNLANADSRAADTGIKKKDLKTFHTVTYPTHHKLDTDCAICLSEFAAGERVRLMPACNHGFHVHCVDKWLTCHSSCPTCRRCLAENCNTKMAAIVNARPQEVVVRMQPLVPERAIRNHGI